VHSTGACICNVGFGWTFLSRVILPGGSGSTSAPVRWASAARSSYLGTFRRKAICRPRGPPPFQDGSVAPCRLKLIALSAYLIANLRGDSA
jgi:hypothetical protein